MKVENREEIILLVILLSTIWLAIIFVRVFSNSINDNPDNIRYLLSSISQSLAATFALAFTITLVAIQLTSKYTPILMDSFFTRKIKLYMSLFVFSIIYPLILLILGAFDKKWTYLSLILSIICFVLLIPYFIYVKDILKPPNLVKNIKRKAVKNNATTPGLILSLYRIATIAYSEGDKRTVEASIGAFSEIIQDENNQYRKDAVEYLEKLAEDCLDDRYIISKILKTFYITSLKFIGNHDEQKDAVLISQHIAHLAWRASDNQKVEIIEEALSYLKNIANVALKKYKKEKIASKVISWIIILGAYGFQRQYFYLENRAYEILKEYSKEYPEIMETSACHSINILKEHERWVLKIQKIEEFLKKYKLPQCSQKRS